MALREEQLEGRGRGMVAARALRGGEELLCETPLLVYQDEEAANTNTFCSHCLCFLESTGKPITQCPSCTSIFCSSRCLQSESHNHRLCKALSHLKTSDLKSDNRTLARFLIAAYNLALEHPTSFQILMSLEGMEFVDDNVHDLHDFLIEALHGSDVDPLGFSVDLTGALLAKDACNAFGLMAPSCESGERKMRGYAIYDRSSLFNHDCLPNACRFEYIDKPGNRNLDVHIRALHDIEEGTEICISYFPINWAFGDRQKKLEEEYGFQCECDRCRVEKDWSDGEDEDNEDAAVKGKPLEDAERTSKGKAKNQEATDEADEDDDDDFGHAMFFVKYLCPVDDCGGTMAPLSPKHSHMRSGAAGGPMECNYCGHLRTEEEFLHDLEEHKLLDDD
ncbi:unnamed protein product [Sphagnum compactum]